MHRLGVQVERTLCHEVISLDILLGLTGIMLVIDYERVKHLWLFLLWYHHIETYGSLQVGEVKAGIACRSLITLRVEVIKCTQVGRSSLLRCHICLHLCIVCRDIVSHLNIRSLYLSIIDYRHRGIAKLWSASGSLKERSPRHEVLGILHVQYILIVIDTELSLIQINAVSSAATILKFLHL